MFLTYLNPYLESKRWESPSAILSMWEHYVMIFELIRTNNIDTDGNIRWLVDYDFYPWKYRRCADKETGQKTNKQWQDQLKMKCLQKEPFQKHMHVCTHNYNRKLKEVPWLVSWVEAKPQHKHDAYFFHGFIISEGQGKKRKSIYNHISLELDPLNYSFSFAIGESFHKLKIYVALNLLLWTEIEEFCQRTGRKKEKRKKKPKQNSDGLSKFWKWKYRDLLLKNGFFPIGHPRVP